MQKTQVFYSESIMDSKLRHDLINEAERLKQIIVFLSSDEDLPFSKEELLEDGSTTIIKLQELWQSITLD